MSVKYRFETAKLQQELMHAIDRGVELTMKQWVKNISGRSGVLRRTGSGVLYRGGLKGKGQLRRRSAPGEPPAVDTGALARSVTDKEPLRTKNLRLVKRSIIGVKWYGFALDAGTAKIKARPWIEPSKELLRAKVGEKYDRYILGELNRALSRYLKRRK